MFIIQNGKISGQKTIDIGKVRIINLTFKSDLTFADDDKFKLVLGSIQSENYAFVDDGCFRFSYVNVGSIINSANTTENIKIYQNGTQILSDTITITADYQGSGSGGTTIDSNVSKIVVDSTAYTDIITVNYTKGTNIYQYTYNGEGSLQLAVSGVSSSDVITFQVWINADTAVSTLIFNENYILLDVPSQLQANKNHVFVVRVYGEQTLVNYSYSY